MVPNTAAAKGQHKRDKSQGAFQQTMKMNFYKQQAAEVDEFNAQLQEMALDSYNTRQQEADDSAAQVSTVVQEKRKAKKTVKAPSKQQNKSMVVPYQNASSH